jgi:SAM-dependent methyltransferase
MTRGSPAGPRRLSSAEMREYWRVHDRRFGEIDYARDPDGLTNICAAGQPLWLGSYYARFQRLVYEQLLAGVAGARVGSRALDVGCGAGRWCRLLADRGYDVTGIDIQPRLIEQNRRRLPACRFLEVALQDFVDEDGFDLVSCVTVIQHLPFEEQQSAVARLRELTKPAGHAIVLENVRFQAPDHFSRSVTDWRELFEGAGFETRSLRTYNFSPALRLCDRARGLLPAPREDRSRDVVVEDVVAPDRGETEPSSLTRRLLRGAHGAALRVAVALDARIEPHLIGRRPPLAPTNCGYLFRAR